MSDAAKLIFFFIFSAFVAVSCENDKDDVIPDSYVNFEINLNDPEFVSLTTMFGSVYINSNTNNWGERAAGFNGNGIIVFAGQEGEFYAYDRTCPHEYSVNGLSVKVSVIDMTYAECPQCKTKYALTAGGTPVSGSTGRYPLKNYKTYFNGNSIHVWNY